MNRYPGVNSQIVNLVKKYALSLHRKLENKIDVEDLQQELMLAAIHSLAKFDPRIGFVKDFVNRCLFMKCREIYRTLQLDKRKINLFAIACPIPEQNLEEKGRNELYNEFDLLEFLPQHLKKIATELKYRSLTEFKKIHSAEKFNLIKKIIIKSVKSEGVKKKMKNISCVEILSVQELSKLSEADLVDLSDKISQTSAWIKQLVEKFDLALETKYTSEAKKKLNENGLDFGTCELNKKEYTVKVQLPKKVQWDQEILGKLYDRLEPEDRGDIFKVTYSIDERKYTKLSQIMTEAVTPARSVMYGKTKIAITKNEEGKNENN